MRKFTNKLFEEADFKAKSIVGITKKFDKITALKTTRKMIIANLLDSFMQY